MEKRDVIKYAVVVVALVGLVGILFVFQGGPTGYAVFEGEDYDTLEECETAGYSWGDITNETCTDIVGCELGVTGCVDTCEECIDKVIGQECTDHVLEYDNQEACENATYVWEDITNETCKDIVGCELGVTGCVDTCEECIDKVIGGECTGDVCDSEHLNLCVDADGCHNMAGGYWYDDVCNVEEECTPSCSGKECGDDGCGGSCGSCDSGYSCSSGDCEEEDDEEDEADDEEEETTETDAGSSNKYLKITEPNKLVIEAGSKKPSTLTVENIGGKYVNCELEGSGEFSSWIGSPEGVSLAKLGDTSQAKFDVNVPSEAEAKDYSIGLKLECNGGISISGNQAVTVLANPSLITGDVVSEEGIEGESRLTGFVIFEGTRGKVTAYVVFLLVLATAVFFVWKRHGQIKYLDSGLLRCKSWFNTKFHRV